MIFSVSSKCQTRLISITSYWRASAGGNALYGALTRAIQDHVPQIRSAAAWALGRYGAKAQPILAARAAIETDPAVAAEIGSALSRRIADVDAQIPQPPAPSL